MTHDPGFLVAGRAASDAHGLPCVSECASAGVPRSMCSVETDHSPRGSVAGGEEPSPRFSVGTSPPTLPRAIAACRRPREHGMDGMSDGSGRITIEAISSIRPDAATDVVHIDCATQGEDAHLELQAGALSAL